MPDLPRLTPGASDQPLTTATLRCVIPPDDSPMWGAVPATADAVDFYLMEIADDDPTAALIAPGYAVLDDSEYLDATPTIEAGS